MIDTASQVSSVGVHFRSGGAYPVLGVPASELRDTTAPLAALWGAKARELRERLIEATTPEARFRILGRALLAQSARPLAHHPVVAFALAAFRRVPPGRSIKEVSHQTGRRQRRFIATRIADISRDELQKRRDTLA